MRKHHDLMSATSETVGKRVRGSLDAAALQAWNRQAVAECGNPQAGHAEWHAHVPSGLGRLQRAGALRDRQVAAPANNTRKRIMDSLHLTTEIAKHTCAGARGLPESSAQAGVGEMRRSAAASASIS